MDFFSAVIEPNYVFPTPFDATGLPPVVQNGKNFLKYFVPRQESIEDPKTEPEITRKLTELRNWTKWSQRMLVKVIGSTHPTVAAALEGNTEALSRSTLQQHRLNDVYAVVSRIYVLANRNPNRTSEALNQPGIDGITPTQQLIDGQMATAYLRAMRVIRPPQPGNMMVGSHPLDVLRASVSVLDED